MKQIVMLVIGLFTILSFNGCSEKIVCVKPSIPNIPEATIIQCKSNNILENSKCTLTNYVEVKKERDILRAAINTLMENNK